MNKKEIAIRCVFAIMALGLIPSCKPDYEKMTREFLSTLDESAYLLAVNDNPEKAYPLVAYSENGIIKIFDLKTRKQIIEQATEGIMVEVLPYYSIFFRVYELNDRRVAPCNSNVLIFASYYPGKHVDTGEIYVFNISDKGKCNIYKDTEGAILIDRYDSSLQNRIVSFVCDSDSKVTKYELKGRYDITGKTIGKYLTDNQIEETQIRKIYHNQVVFYTKLFDNTLYCYSSIFDRTVTYSYYRTAFTQGDRYFFYEKSPDSGGRELVMVDPFTFESKVLASGQSVYKSSFSNYITVKGFDLSERYFTFEGEEIMDIDEYTRQEALDGVSSILDGIFSLFE